MENQRGIIKALILLVVAIAVLLLLSGFAANVTVPLADLADAPAETAPERRTYNDSYEDRANPLLKFLDSGEYGGSDRIDRAAGTKGKSQYAGVITLGMGSASYAIQPYEEYVTLQNEGTASVNITGWKLENGKGTRPIQYSQNSYVYPSPDTAYIGEGTEFLDPSGKYIIGPVILAKGDTAIVTTSGPFTYFPLSINTNFRENMCLGYLDNYPFNPSMDRRCPYGTNDPAIGTVTDECYDYIRSLGRCEDPEKKDKAGFDQQTSHCKAFMRSRLNYPSCVSLNRYSPDFPSKQWRIFLGRSHEMWASSRELITLYDATGLIVDQISY